MRVYFHFSELHNTDKIRINMHDLKFLRNKKDKFGFLRAIYIKIVLCSLKI